MLHVVYGLIKKIEYDATHNVKILFSYTNNEYEMIIMLMMVLSSALTFTYAKNIFANPK